MTIKKLQEQLINDIVKLTKDRKEEADFSDARERNIDGFIRNACVFSARNYEHGGREYCESHEGTADAKIQHLCDSLESCGFSVIQAQKSFVSIISKIKNSDDRFMAKASLLEVLESICQGMDKQASAPASVGQEDSSA